MALHIETVDELPAYATHAYRVMEGEQLVLMQYWDDAPVTVDPPAPEPSPDDPENPDYIPPPTPSDPAPYTEVHTSYAAVRASLPIRLAGLGYSADDISGITAQVDAMYGTIDPALVAAEGF